MTFSPSITNNHLSVNIILFSTPILHFISPIHRYQELRQRFEPPNDKNRWDSPLFKVFNAVESNVSSSVVSLSKNASVSDALVSPEIDSAIQPESVVQTISQPISEEIVATKSSWKPKAKAVPKASSSVSAMGGVNGLDGAIPSDNMSQLTISGSAIKSSIDHSFSLSFETACEKVAQVLLDQKDLPAPNMSTVSLPTGAPELLYEADRVTQEIVQKINLHQKDHGEGTPILFEKIQRSLVLHRFISPSELDRIRRQFVKTAGHTADRQGAPIGGLFIEFLSSQI